MEKLERRGKCGPNKNVTYRLIIAVVRKNNFMFGAWAWAHGVVFFLVLVIILFVMFFLLGPVVAQVHKRVTVNATSCGFDFQARKWNILIFSSLSSKQSAAYGYVTQHTMSLEFSGEWRAEYLNTRLPLPVTCGLQCEDETKMKGNNVFFGYNMLHASF